MQMKYRGEDRKTNVLMNTEEVIGGKACLAFSTFCGKTAAPPAKSISVLAGGVIGVKQTVFNTQELELPRSCSDVGF
jgi:hypothetical protein